MRFAHFEFDQEQDRLGEGPQSEVFRAIDTQLGRVVALKVLRPNVEIDPEARRRFEREAKHTSSLVHPNIATVYEYGQDHRTSFIAMEFLKGRTLDKILKSRPLSFEEGMRVGLQVTSALGEVHRQSLIHRDLKPANVMVLEDGNVKLLDFGICRSTSESNITQSGMLVGTVLYMSPEQVRGEELDVRSDVFALGSVLYHAFTGELAFQGRSFPEVCMAILDGKPRLPSEVRPGFPKPLEDFLLKCLSPAPSERYEHGGTAYGALLGVAEALKLASSSEVMTGLRGQLSLAPVRCLDGVENERLFAASLRNDLRSELVRLTGLQVALIDEDQAAPCEVGGGCYRVDAQLHWNAPKGAVDFSVSEGDESGRWVEILRDRVEHSDLEEFALQAQLVSSTARSLRRKLSEHQLRMPQQRERHPARASGFVRHAHDVLHRGTSKHLLAAISSFRRAIEADPGFALAYAGLAEAMARKFLYWDGDPSFLEEASEHARRALQLDAQCAEGHTSLGFIEWLSGHLEAAQREYQIALQIDRNEWLAHRLLGALVAREGNANKAAGLLRRAIELKPAHIASHDHLYRVLAQHDRYEEALEVGDRGIGAAHKHLREVGDDQDARLHLALLLARMGNAEEAHVEIARARGVAPRDGFTAFHIATVHALLKEPGPALHALKEAQSRGYFIQCELRQNSDFDLLRGVPEFLALTA